MKDVVFTSFSQSYQESSLRGKQAAVTRAWCQWQPVDVTSSNPEPQDISRTEAAM
jgi:hypothetical protein